MLGVVKAIDELRYLFNAGISSSSVKLYFFSILGICEPIRFKLRGFRPSSDLTGDFLLKLRQSWLLHQMRIYQHMIFESLTGLATAENIS